ncbi:hypothetical protein [Thalassobaculum sp.]|uniref:hypothetical protein n=1 Tax=Thalassobaculum sp. TaxID=2022740 RepID=UPI0032ED1E02
MDDGPAGHAMTEIALALAMSFFCLLVLTLVSMGAPVPGMSGADRIEALAAAPAGAPSQRLGQSDRLVVFHGGRFLDADRQALDPTTLVGDGRVVLALDPRLPMSEALAVRARIAVADLIIAPLDATWLAALGTGAGL